MFAHLTLVSAARYEVESDYSDHTRIDRKTRRTQAASGRHSGGLVLHSGLGGGEFSDGILRKFVGCPTP